METARRATLLGSRERRTGINDELLTMVEHEVLGWHPITATLVA
jgi:hypothetical protein